MSVYRFYLFGAPRLEYQKRPVAIDTRKALALLAYLLIEDQPQSRDTLATLLWPESDQSAARAALRRTLSTLRSSLDESLFDFGREILALKSGRDLWCDVKTFHSQLAECQTHGHPEDQVCPQCLAPLQAAADLYAADFMAGFGLRDSAEFDDWQFFETDRLRREFAGVLERLVIIQQQQGEFSAAISAARRWLSLDALNEAAHRALISLYAQSDQRNAALRQYRECVRILDQELGVPPLEETTQLYEAVKENQLEERISSENLNIFTASSSLPTPNRPSATSTAVPLVGRAPEWEQLHQIYMNLRQNGAFAAITGELGIGKTRLAHEFLAQVQARGAITLSVRCYAGENNLAYTPIIDLLRQGLNQTEVKTWWQGLHPHWLSEVALLVPELSTLIPNLLPAQPLEGPGAQIRFYEGVSQILTTLVSGPLPGVIFIDNWEWIDESSLDLLAYFVRRLQGRSVLLLAAWQTEISAHIVHLEAMIQDAKQQGYGFQLPLSPLESEQALELVQYLENHEQPFPLDFKQQLAKASQGVPYFLVEYMQAALAGEIRADMVTSQWPIPIGLRDMLHTRLASLSGTAAQILQAAAIIGGTFDSDLLQTASGRTEEEIVQGIEELLSQNLIWVVPLQVTPNQPVARYDFKQEQIRTLILDDISLVRRRLLHRRVAEALLEQRSFPAQRLPSGQIAYHYQQAGLLEQAAEFYFQAGQAARDVYANADALAYFEAALASGYPKKSEALVETGDLYTLMGDYLQAIQQYEAAAAFSAPASLPPIEQKIGQVYLRRGFWEQAACHFEAALYDLESLPLEQQNAFEAQVRADWSLACYREGKMDKGRDLAQTALDLAESSQDPLALAQAHNLLGILARADQHPKLAAEYLSKGLSFAQQLGNPSAQIAALNNLALAQADQNKSAQAIATLQGALDACLTLGDRHQEAALRNNLADILRASNQDQAAISQLKQAVAIFADIGQNVEAWEPEIWKLVEW